jgi:hypothetical protein
VATSNKPKKAGKPKPAAEKPRPKSAEQRNAEKQALAMWALLGAGGAGFGGKLKPEIGKAERAALLQAGLIESETRNRAYWLTVTDKGWDWAERHLGDPLPEKNFGGAFVLQAWLTRLAAFLQARDLRLADVLATPAVAAPHPEPEPSPEPVDLRQQIRDAYLAVAGGFNRRALLKDLRAELPQVERSRLDQALEQMHFEDGTMLMTLDNPQEITPEVDAAQLTIRGEPMHLLWIAK